VVICLEQGADLHMAQLMPLPLTVSCSSKIQIGFTFLIPAHLGSPGHSLGPLNRCDYSVRASPAVAVECLPLVLRMLIVYVLHADSRGVTRSNKLGYNTGWVWGRLSSPQLGCAPSQKTKGTFLRELECFGALQASWCGDYLDATACSSSAYSMPCSLLPQTCP